VRLNRLGRLRSLAYAILGKVPAKPDRLDTATRMAMDADFTAKPKAEPKGNSQRDEREAPKVDPIEELRRIVDSPADSHRLRPSHGRRGKPRAHERGKGE
jgi:hypothetical protein